MERLRTKPFSVPALMYRSDQKGANTTVLSLHVLQSAFGNLGCADRDLAKPTHVGLVRPIQPLVLNVMLVLDVP
jgi:hypothetical protein